MKSGDGGRGSRDGQDGGSRVSTKRAGEAERSEGKEGKTEQKNVQSGLNRERAALIAIMAVSVFFRWWKIGWKYGRVEVQIGICGEGKKWNTEE